MRAPALAAVILAAALAAGCGHDKTTTTTPTPTSPTTTTFSSRLTPGGAVARQFDATQAGSVTVTLSSAGPAGTRVGLGIGVPSTGIARCSLSTTLTTVASASPQIVAAVDPGSYCVVVYDVGALASEISFDLTIVHP